MVLYYSLDFDLLLTPSFFIQLFDFLLVKIQYVLKNLLLKVEILSIWRI
jgi:hypothetical protein